MGNETSRARAHTVTGNVTLQMCRATAMAVMLLFWGTPLWGATLTWNTNNEPDLAGYHVYHCSQLPCTKSASTAMLLATLGKVTSCNVGTPVVTQYYVITAYDLVNNESGLSSVVTYHPAGTSPPPPAPPAATVNLFVLGSPNQSQPWAVEATTDAAGTVSVQVWINGVLDHTENAKPYCAFGDNSTGGPCTRVQKPFGYYTMEFHVLSNGTEVARQAIVVTATAAPNLAAATVNLFVLGSPNQSQPWAVEATTDAAGTVSVQVWINGVLDHTENAKPYCAFGDNSTGGPCTRVEQPPGYYTMEFRVMRNGTEVARQAIVVRAT